MTSVRAFARFLTSLASLSIVSLASCVTLKSEIKDLQVVGIENVNLTNPGGDGGWLIVTAGEGRPFLRISVATTADLFQLAKDREATGVRWIMYFCNEGPNTRYIFTGASIYSGGPHFLPVTRSERSERNLRRNADGKLLYNVFVENPAPVLMTEYVDGKQKQVDTVDVLNPSKPVCFHFYVGKMVGKDIESNVVVMYD